MCVHLCVCSDTYTFVKRGLRYRICSYNSVIVCIFNGQLKLLASWQNFFNIYIKF